MIKLFACLGSGNCFKPWLAMTQLGVRFDLILIDVLSGEQKSPTYLGINPLGVVPYMQTPDGRSIGESNAMLWYVAEDSDLMPDDPADRAQALQWMFFEQSRLEPYISPARFFTTILPDQREARAKDIAAWQDKAREGLEQLEIHLTGRDFLLLSGYSVADIATFGYVYVLEEAGLFMSDYPQIQRWTHNVAATQGFRGLEHLGRPEIKAA